MQEIRFFLAAKTKQKIKWIKCVQKHIRRIDEDFTPQRVALHAEQFRGSCTSKVIEGALHDTLHMRDIPNSTWYFQVPKWKYLYYGSIRTQSDKKVVLVQP